ncbi:MAG: aldo/keto reductase [Treponema sp.]|nr:aldo/keto reductase [Candidatus Treponema caballi]
MKYRRFPKIDESEISILGFGLMRLPQTKEGEIDEEAVRELVKTAYAQGVNYFDTAYPYHGGKSELVIGKILEEEKLRDKVYLADKCPPWVIKETSDFDRILDEQLSKLRTDHIDFYLMHALNKESWTRMKDLGCIAFLERAKHAGKIKHIGFSFHDSIDVFKEIVDSYGGWEFCQIQYNYLDDDGEKKRGNPGKQALAYAAEHEIGVIVMEPLRGGLLANPPDVVKDIFKAAPVQRTPAEWGLKFVWESQEVVLLLSGMNAMEQMLENCATADNSNPNAMPRAQMAVVSKAKEWFESRIRVPCTGCHYCVPCPQGVSIPDVFADFNNVAMSGKLEGDKKSPSEWYRNMNKNGQGVSVCIGCGACVSKCPQHIDIPAELKKADSLIG